MRLKTIIRAKEPSAIKLFDNVSRRSPDQFKEKIDQLIQSAKIETFELNNFHLTDHIRFLINLHV